jgi:NAD-dependent DNA ligase
MNEPIISDIEYDELCKELKDKWNSIEHYHKHLIDKQSLGAGTGYQLEYNKRIEHGALALLNKNNIKQS